MTHFWTTKYLKGGGGHIFLIKDDLFEDAFFY